MGFKSAAGGGGILQDPNDIAIEVASLVDGWVLELVDDLGRTCVAVGWKASKIRDRKQKGK
jgi:hypothetical protein